MREQEAEMHDIREPVKRRPDPATAAFGIFLALGGVALLLTIGSLVWAIRYVREVFR